VVVPAGAVPRLMAEFQWWLLIVGLVAGGGIVAAVYMDGRRREVDIDDDELRAEASWIAARFGSGHGPDAVAVEDVLRAHREYLTLPAPDRLEPIGGSDGDADQPTHDVGDGRGRGADEYLAPAREEQAPAGQQADSRADREQGADR